MKQKAYFLLFILVTFFAGRRSSAQGFAFNATGAPANASAKMDISSTTKGVLVPRMTRVQRNAIASPATGLMIYQTNGTPGFYFYDGAAWQSVAGSPAGPAGGDLQGSYPNPGLINTGVTAATYGSSTTSPQITVDANGRVTNVTDQTITVTMSGSAGGQLTGSYPNPTLNTSGVTAGSYGSATTTAQITVNNKGRITAANNQTIATGLPSGTNGQVLQLVSGSPAWVGNTLSIGDSYGGGLVGYILQSGDPGYDPIVQHGLIVATTDQSTGIQWYNGSYATTDAYGSSIGTGKWNTLLTVARQGNGSYAAKLCSDYTGGGYSDWYLPSVNELIAIAANGSLLGFTTARYWTSGDATPLITGSAYHLDYFPGFNSYGAALNNKSNAYRVRAVRSF